MSNVARVVLRGRDLDVALGDLVEVSGSDVQRLRQMFPGLPTGRAVQAGIEALWQNWSEVRKQDLFAGPQG